MKKIKLKASWASYRDQKKKNLVRCDVVELAEILAENWGNIPHHLNNTRAMEIHLLAVSYLGLRRAVKEGKTK